MFSISIEARFSAVHRLRLADGTIEPPHGHDWAVRAEFAASALDPIGMVVDFGLAQARLQSVIEDLHHRDLNLHGGFAGMNPTAEAVAKYIHDRLATLGTPAPRRVEVTEAPGCRAAYEAALGEAGQSLQEHRAV